MRRRPSSINCIFAVDKPAGITSHDLVSHVRRALGERRVGHAGTLDPAATGVLVVGVGQATRLLGLLTAERKGYDGVIAFGTQTDTDDGEGQLVAEAQVPESLADEAVARQILEGFLGSQDQVPPAYSAISVDGRRAYDLARSGKEVKLSSRHIEVFESSLRGIDRDESGTLCWSCHFEVSKGTYIRSLARDIGLAAGTVAHLSALRRISSGLIGLDDCLELEELEKRGKEALEGRVLDPSRLLGASRLDLSDQEAADAACGKRLRAPEGIGQGERVCLLHQGQMVGLWHREGRGLRCDINFPQAITGVRG